MRTWVIRGSMLAAVLLCVFAFASPLYATSYPSSTNYRFDEVAIGTGGQLEANSSNFRATTATGDTAVGRSESTNFQTETGTQTDELPVLAFSVSSASVNLGSFSATAAATATAEFKIRNYTSYGYIAQIIGTPPKSGAHTIDDMQTTGSPQTGVEQFGINLVANTSPTSLGANPSNGQFGFGTVTANYGTANNYRFVSGETIASAPKSSGETIYTISYIVNVSSLTPGGQYSSDQTIIVTGTY